MYFFICLPEEMFKSLCVWNKNLHKKSHWRQNINKCILFFIISVCQFYGSTAALFGLMSINSLTAISLERYFVIVGPNHSHYHKHLSNKQLFFMLVIIWFNSAIWAFSPILGWNRYVLEGYQTTCSFDYTV